MVLTNKQLKLSCHMASMPINDRRLIKPVMPICLCSAKFLLYGVNIVPFSNDHNIVSSLICGGQNKPPTEFLDAFLQMSKNEFRLGGRSSKLLQQNEILPSIILKIFSFQLFKALDSTCSRLHQRLQNSCKALAISSWYDLNYIGKGNLYLGPSYI